MPGADHASWCLAMEDEEEDYTPRATDEPEAHRAQ